MNFDLETSTDTNGEPVMIDLAPFTQNGKVRNLSGKDRGVAAREKFRLDDLDSAAKVVHVKIPEYVYSITTSFFCGMFADSYTELGETAFLEKYVFDAQESLMPQIRQGIERCSYDFKPLI